MDGQMSNNSSLINFDSGHSTEADGLRLSSAGL